MKTHVHSLGQLTQEQAEQDRTEKSSEETRTHVDPHLVTLLNPTSMEADQYWIVIHAIEESPAEDRLSVLAISSPTPGDGKTINAINLAGRIAYQPERKVLLVDLDIRQPSVARYLGIARRERGVADFIREPQLRLLDVIRQSPTENLHVITAGRSAIDPNDVFQSPRLGTLLAEARQSYDYVFVDTPPMLLFPDCRLLQQWVDGFILVVAAHQTQREAVKEALGAILPSKLIGVVFNQDTHSIEKYASYYSRYYGHAPKPGRLNFLLRLKDKLTKPFRFSRSSS